MVFIRSIFVAIILCSAAQAQKFSFGNCPTADKLQTIENFDRNQFAGEWYNSRLHYLIAPFVRCSKLNIANEPNNVYAANWTTWWYIGNPYTWHFVLNSTDENFSRGRFLWSYKNIPWVAVPISIIDTDYSSYSILYECMDYLVGKFESPLILTRKADPDSSTIRKIADVLKKRKLNIHMGKVKQQCDDIIE